MKYWTLAGCLTALCIANCTERAGSASLHFFSESASVDRALSALSLSRDSHQKVLSLKAIRTHLQKQANPLIPIDRSDKHARLCPIPSILSYVACWPASPNTRNPPKQTPSSTFFWVESLVKQKRTPFPTTTTTTTTTVNNYHHCHRCRPWCHLQSAASPYYFCFEFNILHFNNLSGGLPARGADGWRLQT